MQQHRRYGSAPIRCGSTPTCRRLRAGAPAALTRARRPPALLGHSASPRPGGPRRSSSRAGQRRARPTCRSDRRPWRGQEPPSGQGPRRQNVPTSLHPPARRARRSTPLPAGATSARAAAGGQRHRGGRKVGRGRTCGWCRADGSAPPPANRAGCQHGQGRYPLERLRLPSDRYSAIISRPQKRSGSDGVHPLVERSDHRGCQSVETTSGAASTSMASTLGCRGPPRASFSPSCTTSTWPSSR